MTTTKAPKPRYRWAHPSEWLDWYLESETHDRDAIVGIARALAEGLDGDDLQDLFQPEMDADGYFHDLNRCPDCETQLTAETSAYGHPSYCATCDREIDTEEER